MDWQHSSTMLKKRIAMNCKDAFSIFWPLNYKYIFRYNNVYLRDTRCIYKLLQ